MSTTIPGEVISMRAAMTVIEAGIHEAEQIGVAVVIWVVDPGGNDVAMARMDGSPLLSRGVAADKAWTSAALGLSTRDWTNAITEDPVLQGLGNNNRMMAVPGGIPLHQGDTLIGAVGVSGASAAEDHQIAQAGVDSLDAP